MGTATLNAARSAPTAAAGSFHLAKWYLDLVTDEGTAAVLYHAELRWGLIRAGYSALLFAEAGQPARTVSTWRHCPPPTLGNGDARWSSTRLGIHGEWHAADPPCDRTLLQTRAGAVRWSCLMPRARATLALGERRLTGWGYVEHLDLTLQPWRLPIDELRWGRFASAAGSVVWINWHGALPLSLVLVNGREVAHAQFSDSAIRWRGGMLRLHSGRTLRRGALGSTVLPGAPLLNALAPRAARALDEHKIVARAELTLGDAPAASGWSIHECVRFRDRAP